MDLCLGRELAFYPLLSIPLDFGTIDQHGLRYWDTDSTSTRRAEADRLRQCETESSGYGWLAKMCGNILCNLDILRNLDRWCRSPFPN